MMGYIGLIELTENERDLLSKIEFDLQGNHDKWKLNCSIIPELWSSLSHRGAIPEVRWRYFSNKEYGPSTGRYSHQDIFNKNGCPNNEIIINHSFLDFLRYFIFGSELDYRVRDPIYEMVERLKPITSGDHDDIWSLSRSLVRKYGLDPRDASEEIFKLLIDIGVYVTSAKHIRDVVRKMRVGR